MTLEGGEVRTGQAFLLLGWVALAVAYAVGTSSCKNECDFTERCDGQTREICGGVDQIVNRRVERVACGAPNDACVAISSNVTACVRGPVTPCDDSFASRCEGSLRVYCSVSPFFTPVDFPARFIAAEDCSARSAGGRCVTDASRGAACVGAGGSP